MGYCKPKKCKKVNRFVEAYEVGLLEVYDIPDIKEILGLCMQCFETGKMEDEAVERN